LPDAALGLGEKTTVAENLKLLADFVADMVERLAMGSRGYAVQLLWRATHRKK
jgi:hypothetical protein